MSSARVACRSHTAPAQAAIIGNPDVAGNVSMWALWRNDFWGKEMITAASDAGRVRGVASCDRL